MFSALTVGILGGGLIGLFLSLRAIRRIAATARPNFVYWAAAIGIVSVAFPAFFLATVVGGSLGGGAGAALAGPFGAEGLGASVGVALGLGLVLAMGLVLGALAGAVIGLALGVSGVGPNNSFKPKPLRGSA